MNALVQLVVALILSLFTATTFEDGHEDGQEDPEDGQVSQVATFGAWTTTTTTTMAGLINEARVAHGLAPLSVSASLNELAYLRIPDILPALSHDGLDKRLLQSRVRDGEVGEILGRTRNGAAALIVLWEDSPSHRAVMYDPYWRAMGTATYEADGTFWAVVEFYR